VVGGAGSNGASIEVLRRCRPCVFASCRHHLLARVQKNGTILFNDDAYRGSRSRALNARKVAGGKRAEARQILRAVNRLWELPETCALDVADRGEHTWPEVAQLLGVDKERVRQIGDEAYAKAQVLLAQYAPDKDGEDDD
jgi:hypothetical protein